MIDNEKCWLKENCNHKDCKNFCVRLYKLDYLYEAANISLKQRQHINLRVDKDGTDKDVFLKLKNIKNDILDFVMGGNQLYLHSNIAGNGKTSWALRFVEDYFNKIWSTSELKCRALFISVPRFLIALKDNITQQSDYITHIKENIFTADIVIWDDIATKNSVTQFEGENLLSLIDSRINLGKTNIFTSNLNDSELHLVLGDRLASRICNLSLNIEFKGSDKRGL